MTMNVTWGPHQTVDASAIVTWIGFRVRDVYGSHVGRARGIWTARSSGISWLLVQRGRFRRNDHTLIPFEDALVGQGQIWVPFDLQAIRSAAAVAPDPATFDADAARALCTHYGWAKWPDPDGAEALSPADRFRIESHPLPSH